ncbi:MAG: type II toxin-antitoxin system RelB/DinJ family antitoxin [Oscillibacter sp.]|nr:type II toxin-antitoxin system RelB/DinJ family antitoxin [Oscillibacter sp.]MBQ9616941.1 type II toxin-antitoxin system RelB/DinJ family antitoxin [Oscillibacter sp.]
MEQATVSVRIDEDLKQQFDALCADFGMSTATAFAMFARAAVREQRLPFPETIPNAETVAALEEAEEMLRNPAKYKRYATFREALDEVLNDA